MVKPRIGISTSIVLSDDFVIQACRGCNVSRLLAVIEWNQHRHFPNVMNGHISPLTRVVPEIEMEKDKEKGPGGGQGPKKLSILVTSNDGHVKHPFDTRVVGLHKRYFPMVTSSRSSKRSGGGVDFELNSADVPNVELLQRVNDASRKMLVTIKGEIDPDEALKILLRKT